MSAHISELAKEIATSKPQDAGKVMGTMKALSTELEKLDARDFEPGAQAEFTKVRQEAAAKAAKTSIVWSEAKIPAFAQRVEAVMKSFLGTGGHKVIRSFPSIPDAGLRAIVERDYLELKSKLMPNGAWKSAVIMAGSIIEAVLFDLLTRDATTKAQAMASTQAPRNKAGTAYDIDTRTDRWTLEKIIDVVFDLRILPKERENIFDHVLRHYRNFVHPRVELKGTYSMGEGEAKMSEGALEAVLKELRL